MKFIIIGNIQAITCKDIFPLIKSNRLWIGCSTFNDGVYFEVPADYEYAPDYRFKREIGGKKVLRVSSICWYTNAEHSRRNQPLALKPTGKYARYDDYEGIEVSKVADIPADCSIAMGVPITFLKKYCPAQFEIIDCRSLTINGKRTYKRIIIKKI